MTFATFLELVGGQVLDGIANETFYLEYLSLEQYIGEEFSKMVPMPAIVTTSDLQPLVRNLWIGGSPTTSPLHYDDYENILCQIRGYKEVVLFPPSDLPYLAYHGRPKGKINYHVAIHIILL